MYDIGVPSAEDLNFMRVGTAKGSINELKKPVSVQDTIKPSKSFTENQPNAEVADVAVPRVEISSHKNDADDDLASMNSSLSAGSAGR